MPIQTYITAAAAAAFIAFLIYLIFASPDKKAEDETAETETDELPEPLAVNAVATEKTCGTEHMGNPYISSTLHNECYCVKFKCDDGEERCFQVTPEEYEKIREGTRGLLVYLDETFYDFDTNPEL